MNKKMYLSLIIGGLFSAGMLYLAFRNVPMAELTAYIGTIGYAWIVPTVIIGILAFVLRAVRWQLILKESISLNFWQAFHPLMIGFMMNCVLPGRVGELARPVILKKEQDLPMATGLATIAVERIFDIGFLIALFALSFSTVSSQPDLDITFGDWQLNSGTLQMLAWAMIRLSFVLLAGIGMLAVPFTRRWIVTLVNASFNVVGKLGPRAKKFSDKMEHIFNVIIEGFADGLRLVGRPKRMLACLGLTVLIWALSALAYYVFAFGCPGIDLTFTQMITVMVVICFFIALPSVPGFWGLWEAGGVFALALFGVATKDAAGFTLVNHAAQLFPVIVVGMISAVVTGINFLQLSQDDKNKKFNKNLSHRSTISEPS